MNAPTPAPHAPSRYTTVMDAAKTAVSVSIKKYTVLKNTLIRKKYVDLGRRVPSLLSVVIEIAIVIEIATSDIKIM